MIYESMKNDGWCDEGMNEGKPFSGVSVQLK